MLGVLSVLSAQTHQKSWVLKHVACSGFQDFERANASKISGPETWLARGFEYFEPADPSKLSGSETCGMLGVSGF